MFIRECLGGGGIYELELNRVRLRNFGISVDVHHLNC